MVVFEINEVEVDHCVGCKGTWLDAGEMELMLDGAARKDELLASMTPDATSGEAQRHCPICEKKMQKVRYKCGDAEPVTLDKCKRNDGLWFDKGELSDILNMGDSPCDHRMYEMLSNVFGRREKSDP
jgi:Zn-finger nucleic acid-binding protein